MKHSLIAFLLINLLSGCYCSCKYPSDYMMPEYDYNKYSKTKDAYYDYQNRKRMKMYDYDRDYIPPAYNSHDDYIPVAPGYYQEDFVNGYPVSR